MHASQAPMSLAFTEQRGQDTFEKWHISGITRRPISHSSISNTCTYPLSEDHVSLTALLCCQKKWLMSWDSDTSALCFPFCPFNCVRDKPRACSGEGGGVLFISLQFILRGLWRSQGHFWINGTLPGPQGPCFVYFSAVREVGGGGLVKQEWK